MPPSPEKRREVDRVVARALVLRARGWSFAKIGASLSPPIGKNTLIMMLRRRRAPTPALVGRKCELPECDIVFEPVSTIQKHCSFAHTKRAEGRRRSARVSAALLLRPTEKRQCRLLECDTEIMCIRIGSRTSKKFCTKTHAARHQARLQTGYYDKLVNRTACEACGWWGPGLERHHIKPRGKDGTNHKRNLAWLCQNCHCLIHSGLATFDRTRTFVDLREEMRSRELARRKVWGDAKQKVMK